MSDLDFRLLYANGAALQILSYPQQPPAPDDSIATRLGIIAKIASDLFEVVG